jgi:integrase
MAKKARKESKRCLLSDNYVKRQKPAKAGQRDETIDLNHHRLRLRVADSGHKSFIYVARFPGSDNPARRALGNYPTTTLAEARTKAREWDALLAKGIDPRDEARRIAAEAERAKRKQAENAFELRAEEWLDLKHVKEQRQFHNTARWMRKELVPVWRGTPIGEIQPYDVRSVIEAIARRSPSSARNVLVVAKSFFAWAVGDDNPAAALRPKVLVGEKPRRQRLLSDDEVRAFWKATGTLGYPWEHLYRLLLWTGVRLREGAGACWSEFDLDGGRWLIPPKRFKSGCHHLVQLTAPVVQMLRAMPRFAGGDYVFSLSNGKRPVTGFGRVKDRIDALMAKELGKEPEPWVVHDLRRVVRTGLASLRISDTVAEMVIGHGHGDQLQRLYNMHQYQDEMREALDQWAAKLRDITTPPPANVRKLREAV